MTEPQFASYASICGWHGCTCQRCGRRYYVDLIVPDDVWAKIKPDTSRDGGLLCGRCMLDAIEASGHGAWLLTDLVNNVTTPAPAEDECPAPFLHGPERRCEHCGAGGERAEAQREVIVLGDDPEVWDRVAALLGGETRNREICDSGEYESYIRFEAGDTSHELWEGSVVVLAAPAPAREQADPADEEGERG